MLAQLVKQRLCALEVLCIEPLGEPAVDRREKVLGFFATVLVAAKPREARGGAQFPELGALLLRDTQSFAIELVGSLGVPLPQQQFAFEPVQLRRQSALLRPFNDLQSIVQQGNRLVSLPFDLTCPSQKSEKMGRPGLRPSGTVRGQTAAQQ